LLLGALMYNVTESSFFRVGHPTWVLLVLLTTCAGSIGMRRRAMYRPKVEFMPKQGIA
jgi:hypothetical protein